MAEGSTHRVKHFGWLWKSTDFHRNVIAAWPPLRGLSLSEIAASSPPVASFSTSSSHRAVRNLPLAAVGDADRRQVAHLVLCEIEADAIGGHVRSRGRWDCGLHS